MNSDDEKNSMIASDDDVKKLLEISTPQTKEIEQVESQIVVAENDPHFKEPEDAAKVVDQLQVEEDKNYAITNLKTITEISITALQTLSGLAEDSQHPRAFEVVAALAKTIADVQKDLMTIHKDKKKLSETKEEKKTENKTVNNTIVFTGSNADLDKMLNERMASMTKIEDIE
jgi:hypothetical protein